MAICYNNDGKLAQLAFYWKEKFFIPHIFIYTVSYIIFNKMILTNLRFSFGIGLIYLFWSYDHFCKQRDEVTQWAVHQKCMEWTKSKVKSLLMKVKEESEKAGLQLNIQKPKVMTSGPISSWQIDGETKETVRDLIFLGSKITADGDCNHEIKRCLLLGRKAMTNQDSIWKSRDITVPTKVHIVKAMVFPVVM